MAEAFDQEAGYGEIVHTFQEASRCPVALIGELASKMTPQEWIDLYESVKPTTK